MFLDELFSPALIASPTRKDQYAFGQIFRVAAYYPHQKLDIWRPKDLDEKLGIAYNFRIEVAGRDAFARDVAWNNPPLERNEEYIALKGKKRPCILIQPPDPALLKIEKGPYSGKIVRHLATVILMYSVEDEVGDAKFPPEFLERVRRLEYKQFMFLATEGPITRDSLVRLDCAQSVAEAQLEPTGFALCQDIAAILRSQLSFFQTGLSAKEFADWASELQK